MGIGAECFISYNVLFQKISIPLPRKVFWFEPPTPLEIPVYKLHTSLSLNILAFETPLPLGISNDLSSGGYGYFLELHNVSFQSPLPFKRDSTTGVQRIDTLWSKMVSLWSL